MNTGKSMCILDLDGTLDLTDPRLSVELINLSKSGMDFVPATGRTNNYVKQTCRQNNIIPPRYIIADNGGTVFDNRERKYLKKTRLNRDARKRILEEYVERGGRLDEIRYTDGDRVYAADDKDVRKYYEKEDIIEYRQGEELSDAILNGDFDITKVTLAGSKKLMKHMVDFIQQSGIKCWSDIGDTKFPVRIRRNYRLDIMDEACSKGEAIKFLTEITGIDNFMCIGNGLNDFSMFKYALESGMQVVVVRNYENGELTRDSQDVIQRVQDFAREIGRTSNVTVSDFPINGELIKIAERKNAKQKRKEFARGVKAEVTTDFGTGPKGKQARTFRTQERGKE